MISTVIVSLSLLMAIAFTLAYLISPETRRRIEAPKFVFLDQLTKYDQSLSEGREQPSDARRK